MDFLPAYVCVLTLCLPFMSFCWQISDDMDSWNIIKGWNDTMRKGRMWTQSDLEPAYGNLGGLYQFQRLFQKLGMNKKTPINESLYKIATVYLNPFRYIIFIKKRIFKAGRQNLFYAD